MKVPINKSSKNKQNAFEIRIAIYTIFLTILIFFLTPIYENLINGRYQIGSPRLSNSATPSTAQNSKVSITGVPESEATTKTDAFLQSCVPSSWSGKFLNNGEKLSYIGNCLDLRGVGFSPRNQGLLIYAVEENGPGYEKFAISLPIDKSIKKITFTLKLNDFTVPFERTTKLFIGVAEGDEKYPKGSYLILTKAMADPLITTTYIFNNDPTSSDYKNYGVFSEKGNTSEIKFVFTNPYFDIIRNGFRNYGDIHISFSDFSDPQFVIGYSVAPGGIVSAEITDFKIEY